MGSFVGIDLGTTFSVMARLDEIGRPVIVHNFEGQNITPSCVAVTDSGEVEVGTEYARRLAMMEGEENAIGSFKREMGTSKVYTLAGQRFTPIDLSALVLQKLVNDARKTRIIDDIEEMIVTIPADFDFSAREATMEAARKAGLNLNYIINEPTAAALYYIHYQDLPIPAIYAVYDLGGGTFDISIVQVSSSKMEILCSNGDKELGGIDFDKALKETVEEKFEEVAIDDELESQDYSNWTAEQDKKALSMRDKLIVRVNRETIDITRYEFEEAISLYINQAETLCESTIEEAGLKVSDIHAVLCVGGSTRVPMVQESIKSVFGKEPIFRANVDEVVALGSALYAAYKGDRSKLSSAQKDKIGKFKFVQERTSKSYGTIVVNKDMNGQPTAKNSVLIEKNSKIPCSVTKSYFTNYEGQTVIYCFLAEGSDDETDLQSFDGRIRSVAQFNLPPGRPAGQKVEVTFSYDDNQTMQCSFKDCKTGKNYTIETKPALWGEPKNSIDFDDWVSSVEAGQFTISDEINSDEGDSI